MARNIKYVVNSPCYPVVTIFVTTDAITGEIIPFVSRIVGLDATFVIPKDGSELPWPGAVDCKDAGSGAFNFIAVSIKDYQLDPKKRSRLTSLRRMMWRRSADR